jgi:hypothetical protein
MPTFLDGDGSWWVGAYTAAQSDIYEIPLGADTGAEPSNINGWKFAALMDVNSFGSAPRVVFELIAQCYPGGGRSVLATSQDATHKARLRLRGSDMASMYRGRCMWVRARVASASGSFPMRVMEYSHLNTRLYRDM